MTIAGPLLEVAQRMATGREAAPPSPHALSACEADVIRKHKWALETERLCLAAERELRAAQRRHKEALVAYTEQVAEHAKMQLEAVKAGMEVSE